jgi:hypothetical protein
MLSLQKLCDIINEHFGEPFLVAGGVSAELVDNDGVEELSINIGRRDLTIDTNGEVVGCGTFLSMPPDTLVFDDGE